MQKIAALRPSPRFHPAFSRRRPTTLRTPKPQTMTFEHKLLGFAPPPAPVVLEDACAATNAHQPLLAALALDQVDALARALERSPMPLDALLEWRGEAAGGGAAGAQQQQQQQRTMLGLAAYHGSLNVLSALLAAGANPTTVSPTDGFTPLHCACAGASSRTYESIQQLLSAGADKDALDNKGRKPVDLLLCVMEQAAQSGGSSDEEVRRACRVTLDAGDTSCPSAPTSPTHSAPLHAPRPTACATWSSPSTAPTSFGCTASR